MKYEEAFRSMGYELVSVRQDWSSANDQGVCITIWQKETASRDGRSFTDTRIHSEPIEIWRHKSGNRKRIQHIQKAIHENDGFVDVVIVTGTPGQGYGNAVPWLPIQRQNKRWKISFFDLETGHYAAELV